VAPTIFALGHNIASAWRAGDDHYDEKVGTSMPAPFASGVAALHATSERIRARHLAQAADQ
jgi:subtilisin family serine protease